MKLNELKVGTLCITTLFVLSHMFCICYILLEEEEAEEAEAILSENVTRMTTSHSGNCW